MQNSFGSSLDKKNKHIHNQSHKQLQSSLQIPLDLVQSDKNSSLFKLNLFTVQLSVWVINTDQYLNICVCEIKMLHFVLTVYITNKISFHLLMHEYCKTYRKVTKISFLTSLKGFIRVSGKRLAYLLSTVQLLPNRQLAIIKPGLKAEQGLWITC